VEEDESGEEGRKIGTREKEAVIYYAKTSSVGEM
jgi:hypothetical protein